MAATYSIDNQKERENAEVVELIKRKLDDIRSWPSDCNIERVPEIMLKEKLEPYKPLIVSIGPSHHDEKHLQPMEAYKIQFLDNFLRRSNSVLENYIKAVIDLEEKAFSCYPEMKFERKMFFMMMVVDGCFILEMLLKLTENYFFTDLSVFKWSEFAFVDVMLLENQLPFFVVEELYRVVMDSDGSSDSCSLRDLICSTLAVMIMSTLFGKQSRPIQLRQIPLQGKPRHLLDFVRQCLISSSPMSWPQGPKNVCDDIGEQIEEDNPIPCATKLMVRSVKFEINNNPESLLDIKFEKYSGVLKISPITVDKSSCIILQNLIACEFYTKDHSYFTEYIVFLKGLINSSEDVELLKRSGIFMVRNDDPEHVAKLFNDAFKYIPSYQYFTRPVCCELSKYYNKQFRKWKADLWVDYNFKNPWTLLSVINAGIIILGLTITQTVYTVLSYYHK